MKTKKMLKESVEMNGDIQFLKELQQELKTQEIDNQAAPRFWTIMDYKYLPTTSDYADSVVLYDADACETMSIDDYVEEIVNGEYAEEYTEKQKEDLKKAVQGYGLYDLENWIEENEEENIEIVHQMEESFIAWNTLFFTKEEAVKHLESNRHHYSSKAHTFAMTVWRAPKMAKLMNILENFDWDSICINEKESRK